MVEPVFECGELPVAGRTSVDSFSMASEGAASRKWNRAGRALSAGVAEGGGR